jgi:hypothetical protein
MFWTGGGLFILGFIIWNLDNVFCTTLTRWKVAIGWPVAFLLEGKCTMIHRVPVRLTMSTLLRS